MSAQFDDDAEATAAQMRAMANPVRVRLWAALGDGEATISQLSHRLALNKGSVSHHLRVLVESGLVRRGRTGTVRGGTEKYFARTKARLLFPHVPGDEGPGQAMMQRLIDDLKVADDPQVHQRRIRMTPAQARALAQHLDDVLHSLAPADERHMTYEVVTAIYRRR